MGAIVMGHKEANQIIRAVGWNPLKVHIDSHAFGLKFWRPMDEYGFFSKGACLKRKIVRVRGILCPLFDAPRPEGI